MKNFMPTKKDNFSEMEISVEKVKITKILPKIKNINDPLNSE